MCRTPQRGGSGTLGGLYMSRLFPQGPGIGIPGKNPLPFGPEWLVKSQGFSTFKQAVTIC